jgi:hypothetical protein
LRVINDVTVKDLDPLTKSISGSIGLQPNSHTTMQEGKQISSYSKDFMRNGIQQIIDASNSNSDYDVVKQAEPSTVLAKFSSIEDISLFPYHSFLTFSKYHFTKRKKSSQNVKCC